MDAASCIVCGSVLVIQWRLVRQEALVKAQPEKFIVLIDVEPLISKSREQIRRDVHAPGKVTLPLVPVEALEPTGPNLGRLDLRHLCEFDEKHVPKDGLGEVAIVVAQTFAKSWHDGSNFPMCLNKRPNLIGE